MKNPARWLIAVALSACVLAWWWNRPPPEPRYEGKPLSQWMRETYSDAFGMLRVYRFVPVDSATAVKWLAYTAEHGHSPTNNPSVFERFRTAIRWRRVESKWPDGYDERLVAIRILGGLGADAKPAIPILLRVLNSENYDHVADAAAALHGIGPASWPGVEERLAHGSNLARCELLNTIWQRLRGNPMAASGGDATKVFTLLADALRDSEPNIRRNAASALAHAIDETGANVPKSLLERVASVLWTLPGDSNLEVHIAKGRVLRYYRETKADAVPRLTALLTDPDEAKRDFARSVLDQLAKP